MLWCIVMGTEMLMIMNLSQQRMSMPQLGVASDISLLYACLGAPYFHPISCPRNPATRPFLSGTLLMYKVLTGSTWRIRHLFRMPKENFLSFYDVLNALYCTEQQGTYVTRHRHPRTSDRKGTCLHVLRFSPQCLLSRSRYETKT